MGLINTYSVDDTFKIADDGSQNIEKFLYSYPGTTNVINVEKDKEYQKIDIDLVWEFLHKGKLITKLIEIKVDTYENTPNIACETISNTTKNTLGCFRYTKADYILYYFIKTGELFFINIKEVQPWFEKNFEYFREVSTRTPFSNGKGFYTTKCRLLPKKTLLKEFPKTKVINLNTYNYDKKDFSIFEEMLLLTKNSLNYEIDNLPQANVFNNIIEIFNYIKKKKTVSTLDVKEYFKWSDRETNYHLHAMVQLHLIFHNNDNNEKFKSNTYEINNNFIKYPSRQNLMFSQSILENPICNWMLNTYMLTNKFPNKFDILFYIKDNFSKITLSDSTILRRINCLTNWCTWVITNIEVDNSKNNVILFKNN
jgi:hypothetical protein